MLWEIIPEEFREPLQNVEFREGIAKIRSFIAKGALIHRPDLAIRLQGKMFPEMECYAAWQEIPGNEFEQLISAVKNRILDFVLGIEAENPDAGEAEPNTHPVPTEKLQPLVQNIFHGTVGNIAQNSERFSQAASIGIERSDVARLVTEFTNHLDELGLDPRDKQRAEAQIATLKAQLIDEPDPVIVKHAVQTLRNITEGAIGSLIAAGAQPAIWHWIHQLMTKFF